MKIPHSLLIAAAIFALAACSKSNSADNNKNLNPRQAAALQYASTICVTWAGMGKIWNFPSDNRVDIDAAVVGMRRVNFEDPKLAYLESLGQRIAAQVKMTSSWDSLSKDNGGKQALQSLCLERVRTNSEFNSAILQDG